MQYAIVSDAARVGVDPVNIGIFVTSLAPKGASQARIQSEIFNGLRKLNRAGYRFMVFSYDSNPPGDLCDETFSFHRIERHNRWEGIVLSLRKRLAQITLAGLRLSGLDDGQVAQLLRTWRNPEPKHYRQLRALNIRLLWNMNQHELRTGLPFVRTIWDVNHRIHSMYPEYSYTRYQFDGLDAGLSDSLARASYVIVGTEEGKQQLIRIFGVHEGKIRIIPFPVPALQVTADVSKPAGEAISRGPYLFYPARFWPHKNHVVILAAMKILQEEAGLKLRCIFSGADQGNLEHVLRYAEMLGVRNQVDYLGSVSDEDLSQLYAGAAALVYASAVGPDNLPPLEAMSLGCPVITADVPGAREQLGDAAVYFAPTSERQLAERLKMLLGNESLRERLISAGKKRAASWGAENYAKEVISIFDDFSAIARSWDKCDSVFT